MANLHKCKLMLMVELEFVAGHYTLIAAKYV